MIDTDHPELVEFEGETLGDTITNLLLEIKRLRKALYWVAVEETREDVEYLWKGVDEILSGHPDWVNTKCIQTGEEWDYTKRDWTIDRAKEMIE